MLALPSVGMARSTEVHNIDLAALCDWIEGNILFDEEELSPSDVVDLLIETQIYAKQDFAWEIVQVAWAELGLRLGWLEEAAPVRMESRRATRLRTWQETPAHSFCLTLSFAKWYPTWARQFGMDYTEQGELFEALTKEGMERLFPGWVVHPTGWTRTHADNLNEVVNQVVTHLGEARGDVERWTDNTAHEAGLDLLCYRPFVDHRVGMPVFLMQCGSGGRWEGKLKTPDLRIWTKIVQFASDPKKAFAMPYALSEREFRQSCLLVNGLLLDRYRLLSAAGDDPNWVSSELQERIIAWIAPRLNTLPRADV